MEVPSSAVLSCLQPPTSSIAGLAYDSSSAVPFFPSPTSSSSEIVNGSGEFVEIDLALPTAVTDGFKQRAKRGQHSPLIGDNPAIHGWHIFWVFKIRFIFVICQENYHWQSQKKRRVEIKNKDRSGGSTGI